MPRIVSCPYCGFNLPARGRLMFCPVCDERIKGPESIVPYRPLPAVDYTQPLPPPVSILIAPPDDREDGEREREAQRLIYAIQPWYLRSGTIVFFLFFLAPLGILLMWAQRPRRPFLGGTFHRLLVTLLFGGLWLGGVIYLDTQLDLFHRLQHWIGRASARLENRQAPASATITLEMFNRLKLGDPLAKVKSVLGPDGDLMSQAHLDGVPGIVPAIETAVYEWRNPDGGTIHLVFQNGALAQKSQFGLLERDGSLAVGEDRRGADTP